MGEGNVLTRVCPSIHDSVCPRGGGSGPAGRGGGSVLSPAGQGGGQGQRSILPGGSGQRSIQLAGGSGQRSSWPGGGVRVKGQSSWGGVRSKVNPAGGSGPARGGQVQLGGVRSSQQGGVSILRPLAGGMPLAFTQEDFLVFR